MMGLRWRGQNFVGVCVVVVMAVMVVVGVTAEGVQAAKQKNGAGGGGGGGGKGNKRKSKGAACEMTATQLETTPFKVMCDKGLISSISVRGHNGSSCQGLTPDLFIQVNSCFWKRNCTLTYSTKGRNYMLKLYKGNMTECVTKQADKFTFSYECTKKVTQPHIVRKRRGKREKERVVKDKQGVLLSHPHHPWLYPRHDPRHQPHGMHESISLQSPKKKLKVLAYTIRTLDLMAGDNLTVNWTVDGVEWTDRQFHADYRLTGLSNTTFTVPAMPRRVVFSLTTSRYTSGGEGFVICFRWMKKVNKLQDVCKKLMKTQCGGKRGKGGKGGRRGKGGKGGRRGKGGRKN